MSRACASESDRPFTFNVIRPTFAVASLYPEDGLLSVLSVVHRRVEWARSWGVKSSRVVDDESGVEFTWREI